MATCRVAALDDIKPGGLLRVNAQGTPICLARLDSGEVFAINDICSHEDVELSDGELQGNEVECPAHGSRFRVDTGAVRGLPAEEPVAAYAVTIDGNEISVEV